MKRLFIPDEVKKVNVCLIWAVIYDDDWWQYIGSTELVIQPGRN